VEEQSVKIQGSDKQSKKIFKIVKISKVSEKN
jgi:hypothetical protein